MMGSNARLRRIRLLTISLLVVMSIGPVLGAAQETRVKASEIVPSSVFILGGMECVGGKGRGGNAETVPTSDTCQASIPGSGTIVTRDKLILTSASVALDPQNGAPVWTAIGLTTDPRQLPEIAFFARAVVYDEKLGLALLQPAYTLDGQEIGPDDLASLTPLTLAAEPDAVELEQDIRLIGYPFAEGFKETIGVVPGQVAGFLPDADNPELGNQGWVKADSSAGSRVNGGTAVDDAGRLIGVPSSGRGGNVQCQDVNGDGEIDQVSECIVRGGEIELIRPIPEGLDLLYNRAEAAGQMSYQPPITPAAGDTPAPEETPAAEETPAPEETPAVTVTPAAGSGETPPATEQPVPPSATEDPGIFVPGPIGQRPGTDPAEQESVLVEGTLVSADTDEPIVGGYVVVPKQGTTIQEMIDSEFDPELVAAFGESNGQGHFKLNEALAKDASYGILIFAENYDPIGGDDALTIPADAPETLHIGTIELAAAS